MSKLGTYHVHVDGETVAADAVIAALQGRWPVARMVVSEYVAGPQRDDARYAGTYDVHTPGGRIERFTCFITIEVVTRDAAVECLNIILPIIQDYPGTDVEVEQLVASGVRQEHGGTWDQIESPEFQEIGAHEVEIAPRPTARVEVHHIFTPSTTVGICGDVIRRVNQMEASFSLGGVFLGADGQVRTNQFFTGLTDALACAQLQAQLLEIAFDTPIKTKIELVHGIWKS